jgi:DNA invertase Pin-like site-specific DNA recombinase
MQQVQRHQESAQVKANLQGRARQWGWPRDRIRVLDGDQGRSGTTTDGRDDFAWLLSEIALGHVGIVFGLQINRLAREDEACCRLIKTCAVFDTLLADLDGVYHPHDFNDRMLLTLKGFMGGFELHQLQQRMQAGRLNRAQRGEWMGQPPIGYIVGPHQKLQFDPDEQVQQRMHLLFEQFERIGSINGLLEYLRHHRLDLPARPRFGPQAGVLHWRRPTREGLRLLMRDVTYTGTFTWGRSAVVPSQATEGRRGRRGHEPEQCQVFRRDNHDAYITWEQYHAHRHRLRTQRRRGPRPGPQRDTQAVLAGLIVCGDCGARLQTRYTKTLRYQCQRHALDHGAKPCPSFAGAPLERLVAEQIWELMTPAGLELCWHALEDCQRQRATLEKNWQLRLQRARHEAERAFRQYDAVEPENRLVARTLERAWEEKLQAHRQLEEEHDRFVQQQPPRLSAAERAQIEALASDLPALWHSPQTSIDDRRHIVRLLLERVVVWVSADCPQVKVHLHWVGGAMTEHQTTRALASWRQLPKLQELLDQLRRWRDDKQTSKAMAEALNARGERNLRGQPFTAANVRQLLSRLPRRKGPKKRSKRAKS